MDYTMYCIKVKNKQLLEKYKFKYEIYYSTKFLHNFSLAINPLKKIYKLNVMF